MNLQAWRQHPDLYEEIAYEFACDKDCINRGSIGLVTEKPVDFVDFDSVVKFNKNRQNDDNVVKAYKS